MAQRLLAWLRRELAAPALAFAEAPVRIHGGFDTAIFAFRLTEAKPPFDAPLVLRLYRAEQGAAQARFEGAVHEAVAARGFPTPRALAVGDESSGLPGAFLILERVAGRNALRALASTVLPRIPALLANAQAQLHSLDAVAVLRDLAAAGVPADRLAAGRDLDFATGEVERLALDGLRPALDWLRAGPPTSTSVICHGDFHPLNVMIDGRAVSGVIDWTRVREAPPEYDVGASIALMTQGEIRLPPGSAPLADAARRVLVALYLRAYRRRRALDPRALRHFEALRCVLFLVEAGEHRRADAGEIPRPSKATAFAGDRTVRRIAARLRQIAGVAVAIPPGAKPGAGRAAAQKGGSG